jgi:hypothetical protein
MEAIVPCRLEHVDAARLHGGPCLISIGTGLSRDLAAFLAHAAGAGQENEGLIMAVLEDLPFEVDQHAPESLQKFSPLRSRQGLDMKQDGPVIGIEDPSRFLIGGRMRRAAIAVVKAAAAELTLPSHPWGCDHAGWIDGFCMRRSIRHGMVAILLQVPFDHDRSPQFRIELIADCPTKRSAGT